MKHRDYLLAPTWPAAVKNCNTKLLFNESEDICQPLIDSCTATLAIVLTMTRGLIIIQWGFLFGCGIFPEAFTTFRNANDAFYPLKNPRSLEVRMSFIDSHGARGIPTVLQSMACCGQTKNVDDIMWHF